MKTCRLCKVEKPKDQFHLNKSRKVINGVTYPQSYRGECKTCRAKGGVADSNISKTLKKEYGLTRPCLGTPCDCCGKIKGKLLFDHCHDTMEFRGWICSMCNTAIGHFGDNLKGIKMAEDYLRLNRKHYNV